MKKLNLNLLLLALLAPLVLMAQNGQQSEAAIASDGKYFTDATYTVLKPRYNRSSVVKKIQTPALKEAAGQMVAGGYDLRYRAAEYSAYPSNNALYDLLKLSGGWSKYDNITGMYLDAGQNVVIVGPTHGKEIRLLVPDWTRRPVEGERRDWSLHRQEIPLHEGVNVIELEKSGNVYVSYFDDEPSSAPRIRVHFVTGRVNGIFDSTVHGNDDFDRMLAGAVGPVLDCRSKYMQVAYMVEDLRKFVPGQGKELMDNYDRAIALEYELMGLFKYDRVPSNHLLAREQYFYYMFRDGDGVAYLGDEKTLQKVMRPDNVITGDGCWGFSHEVGHALQMPELRWGGMTEVSNNIYCMYNCLQLGIPGRAEYDKGYREVVESSPKISYLQHKDVFVRLTPFWQIYLYCKDNGKPEFYQDLMEAFRNQPRQRIPRQDNIWYQFNFVRTACDVAQTDLTKFFEDWGFFYTGDIELDDYGSYHHVITPEMVKETKDYIASKNYPQPIVDVARIGVTQQ